MTIENSTQDSGDDSQMSDKDALFNAILGDDGETDSDPLVAALTEGDDESDDVEVDESESDEDDEQENSDDPIFKIKVDGKEVEVSQSDLLKNAAKSMSADGRFKEAADIRKQSEASLAEVAKERQLLSEALHKYNAKLQASLEAEQPDWQALLNENPAEFVRQKHAFEVKQHELQQIQAANAYLMQQNQAVEQKKHAEYVATETQKLVEAIPAWKDKAKAVEGGKAVAQYLAQMGFDDNALSTIVDHRLVLIAHKASLYDAAVAKQKSTQTTTKPAVRNERPTNVQKQPKGSNKQAAEKAFKQSPNKDTLAAFLL